LYDTRLPAYLARAGITLLAASEQYASSQWKDPAVIMLQVGVRSGASLISVGIDLAGYPMLAVVVSANSTDDRTSDLDRHQRYEQTPTGACGDLRNAIARIVLEPVLTCLAALDIPDVQIVSVERAKRVDLQNKGAVIPLLYRVDCTTYFCEVWMPPFSGGLAFESMLPRLKDAYLDLRLPGKLVVGKRHYLQKQLRALALGDVLLNTISLSLDAIGSEAPNDHHASANSYALAVWGFPTLSCVCAHVKLGVRSLTVSRAPFMAKEIDMTFPDSAGKVTLFPQGDCEVDVTELEVPVQFEVDTIALRVSQLSTLGSGYVIELDKPVSEMQIRLVIHGQTIGYGELVAVGEHLGVRIVHMVRNDGTA
jgi:type III secretion protein Q